MKRNLIKSGAFAVLMTLSGVAFGSTGLINHEDSIKVGASQNLEVKIFPRGNDVLAINLRKQETETVKVKIVSQFGRTVFKESIKSKEIVSKRYNIDSLPDGIYFVEVFNENYMIRKMITKRG